MRLIRLMLITPRTDRMPCRVTGKGYMDVNRISGYIPGKMVFFLMQVTLGWSLASVILLHAASGPSLLLAEHMPEDTLTVLHPQFGTLNTFFGCPYFVNMLHEYVA